MPKEPENPNAGRSEGEGDKKSDLKYRRDVEKFVDSHDTGELGRRAADEIERDNRGYREAEDLGKSKIAEEDPEVQGIDRRKS